MKASNATPASPSRRNPPWPPLPPSMRALSSFDALVLWESGAGLHPLDRALLALCAALPDTPQDTLADWPLGRRNRALFELHRYCFGSRLAAWAACMSCQEKMEFVVDSRDLMAQT